MQRLDFETWENIFRNTKENNEEVEIVWFDTLDEEGEWCLCCDCELFEDSFKTEKEAIERLNYLRENVKQ